VIPEDPVITATTTDYGIEYVSSIQKWRNTVRS
jgi:hypothetical protein